jgi:hypothetical protein
MGGCVSLVELDYIDCETLQKHTFEIDMGGPISLDVLDDAFATVVQRRIVSVADADARRIEIQKRRGQWWEVFVVFVIRSLFLSTDQYSTDKVWNWEVGGCSGMDCGERRKRLPNDMCDACAA